MTMKKEDLIGWLRDFGHDFPTMTPAVLLRAKAREIIDTLPSEVETLLRHHGHSVLWTPPYHSNFQPIELVWAETKRRVADAYDNAHGSGEFEAILNQSLDSIDKIHWSGCIDHVLREVRNQMVADENTYCQEMDDSDENDETENSDNEDDFS